MGALVSAPCAELHRGADGEGRTGRADAAGWADILSTARGTFCQPGSPAVALRWSSHQRRVEDGRGRDQPDPAHLDRAWYYGNWSNPAALRTFSYTEGDTTLSECATDAEFCELMRSFGNMDNFKGVDDMCSDEIRAAFERLGLAALLYQNRPQVA